jgi:hypothetical protein
MSFKKAIITGVSGQDGAYTLTLPTPSVVLLIIHSGCLRQIKLGMD